MQSQQKRLKWSRGETAEALEERTDTGITQASVELMENCIPDIYGNVSRRPALSFFKSLYSGSQGHSYATGFIYDQFLQVIPFYITENDIVLVGLHGDGNSIEFIRIKDNKFFGYAITSQTSPKTRIPNPNGTGYIYKPVSFSQQNNYMVLADEYNLFKLQIDFPLGVMTPSCEIMRFSAGFYAPYGTKTKIVSSSDIPGLSFDSSSVGNYTYTETSGSSVVYSWIKTGLSASSISSTWTGATTTFYCGLDTGGVFVISTTPPAEDNIVSWTMTNGSTYTSNTRVASHDSGTPLHRKTYVDFIIQNNTAYFYATSNNNPWGWLNTTLDVTNKVKIAGLEIANIIPAGSIVQFPENGGYMRVEGYDSDGSNLRMYGSLLTPIANKNTTDTRVNVEYGYVDLMPSSYSANGSFPHPAKLCFNEQRLWAGDWKFSESYMDRYALVIGSQIERYDDFSNNYNQENEPITLDILTKFKEKIVHLFDYNGLKIFTDCYEYTYENGGVVKQSANGSLEQCEPIIFDSLCLYVDSTGCQVKAMQYEFQSSIFNSSTINQLAPHDLVWNPLVIASYEDKTHNTGKYLFVKNEESDNNPCLAVCNFVPSNQATIWSRWIFPKITDVLDIDQITGNLIHNIVNTKAQTIFLIKVKTIPVYENGGSLFRRIVPAVLDWEKTTDLETTLYSYNNKNYVALAENGRAIAGYPEIFTLPNTEVAVYSDGEFKFLTTTDIDGVITDDLTGLKNITVGLPINATIRSHPIDVGGKTKSVKKRIGKAQISVHDTEPGAITINGKTGYANPQHDHICFYGVTGMKDEIKYTITNKNGAMFHLESLLMNVEYGTLDS